MRAAALLALIVLLAGCTHAPDELTAPVPSEAPEPERLVDGLTTRLAPESGPFFPELSIEDGLDLPGGGRMEFAVGLGMRCQGNATSAAWQAGWVSCSVRLTADPSAQVTSRRELELGFDYQPLTPRTAAEPVEWRVLVEVPDAMGNLTAAFESGWRPVDLSPRVSAPTVTVDVEDPCDAPDAQESTKPPFGPAGKAVLNVSFTASHARPTVHVDLNRSKPGPPGSSPYAAPEPGEHNLTAAFPVWDAPRTMWLRVPVDLEAEETPSPDAASGPCMGAVAHQVQQWSIAVSYVGADGRGGRHDAVQPVDVYLAVRG